MAKVEYKKSDQFFVNPYNFVPVNLKKTGRDDVTKQNGNLTGYLQCRIQCRTPLAIPDVEKKIEEKIEIPNGTSFIHNKYPFFMVDEKPVIPGSAIRGVIRNVYETLTDSCFGAMQGDVAITVRSSEPFWPGLLKWNGNKWELYQAKRHLVVVDKKFHTDKKLNEKGIRWYITKSLKKKDNLKTGEKIYFEHLKEEYKKNGKSIGTYVKKIDKFSRTEMEWKEGYLCFGEQAPNRHFQSIFEQQGLVPNVRIDDSVFQKMEDILREYRNEKKNRLYDKKNEHKHQGYPDYEAAKEAGVVPVYYKVQSGKLYMTFAALGRKAYNKTWDDITAEKSHRKCNGRNNLCPACALFGTMEGDKLGSRIRFTDAHCTGDTADVIEKNVTFAELGSPKISYTPFYLKEKKAGANYADGYDSPDLEIRGRKFYWHHIPRENKVKKNNRNATFDVIKEGTRFAFRIYFDGITKRQLELLAMAVHLNENNLKGNMNMCHKMGHGKPLGYGSVKIFIESCKLRSFDLDKGWKETDGVILCGVKCDCGDTTKEKDAFFAICNFDAAKKLKVEYPAIFFEGQPQEFTENDLASHKWFTNNYRLGSKGPNMKFPEIQTEIQNEGRTLKKYTPEKGLPNLDKSGRIRR